MRLVRCQLSAACSWRGQLASYVPSVTYYVEVKRA